LGGSTKNKAGAMRWGRGFFRAWIVLSAIWIGLLVYNFGPTTYRLPWIWQGPRVTLEIRSPGGGQTISEFDPSKSQAQLTEDATIAMKNAADKSVNVADRQIADESLPTVRQNILTNITQRYDEMRQEARTAWLFTLIPPIALLVFGLCTAWILRGFRRAT
jgi:hypothetical protein